MGSWPLLVRHPAGPPDGPLTGFHSDGRRLVPGIGRRAPGYEKRQSGKPEQNKLRGRPLGFTVQKYADS